MNKNLSSLLACASATFVAFTLALPAFAADQIAERRE